jgi:hypothetical protein
MGSIINTHLGLGGHSKARSGNHTKPETPDQRKIRSLDCFPADTNIPGFQPFNKRTWVSGDRSIKFSKFSFPMLRLEVHPFMRSLLIQMVIKDFDVLQKVWVNLALLNLSRLKFVL